MFRKPIPFKVKARHPREDEIVSITGLRSAERAFAGLLRIEGDEVVLQFRAHDYTLDMTTLGGNNHETDTSEAHEIRVPLIQLGAVEMKGWWRGKLILTSLDLTTFEALGVTDGRLVLTVARKIKPEATELATALAFRLSDMELAGIDEDIRRLESGESDPPV
jgi:hypothetical protein